MKNTTSYKTAMALIAAFAAWTILVLTVDVQPAGIQGTDIGFAALNLWFHNLTGAHLTLYTITDWLGLVPVAVCLGFALLGLIQWVKRGHLLQVDFDILALGVYYVVVIGGYLLFEMIPINYRPILIEGRMEVSYPSSTTLLVLSVMPTLVLQLHRRISCRTIKHVVTAVTMVFTVFMVVGRLVSGVHWITDIMGAMLLSGGLFLLYKAVVLGYDKRKK